MKLSYKYVLFVFYVCLFFILFICYGDILSFSFWKDDWINVWLVLNRSSIFYTNWLHPGSLADFFIFGRLLGDRVMYWLLAGFVMKIIAAWAIQSMTSELTRSQKAGFIAAAISTFTVLGLDAITWIAPRVVIIDVIFLCFGMTYWFKFITSNSTKDGIFSFIFLAFAVISDPGRMFPLPVMLLATKPFARHWVFDHLHKYKYLFWVGVVFTAYILLLWQWRMLEETIMYKFITSSHARITVLSEKLYFIGNFFNSIFNLFLGWLLPIQEYLSTALYIRFNSRLGFAVAGMTIISFLGYLRVRSKNSYLVTWLFLWAQLFYMPGWMAEPRLTMGVTHRYMVIPSIGVIILLAYFISRISFMWKWITVLVIGINIVWSRHYINEWKSFRFHPKTEILWRTVVRDSGQTNRIKIFSFTGDAEFINRSLSFTGVMPYAIYAKVSDPKYFAFLYDDPKLILPYVCQKTWLQTVFGNGIIKRDQIPLVQVFRWSIDKDGGLQNQSSQFRKDIEILASKTGCQLIYPRS